MEIFTTPAIFARTIRDLCPYIYDHDLQILTEAFCKINDESDYHSRVKMMIEFFKNIGDQKHMQTLALWTMTFAFDLFIIDVEEGTIRTRRVAIDDQELPINTISFRMDDSDAIKSRFQKYKARQANAGKETNQENDEDEEAGFSL